MNQERTPSRNSKLRTDGRGTSWEEKDYLYKRRQERNAGLLQSYSLWRASIGIPFIRWRKRLLKKEFSFKFQQVFVNTTKTYTNLTYFGFVLGRGLAPQAKILGGIYCSFIDFPFRNSHCPICLRDFQGAGYKNPPAFFEIWWNLGGL